MKKVTRKQTVTKPVVVEVPVYITSDEEEFDDEKGAQRHEKLLKTYPKLGTCSIEWIEDYLSSNLCVDNEGEEGLEEALKSDKVVIIGAYSGGDDPFFEVVEPYLVAVEAVIKVLHRKTIGCNYKRYVDGVIYKGESLCFNDKKKSDGSGYYETGEGRNIKEVLK